MKNVIAVKNKYLYILDTDHKLVQFIAYDPIIYVTDGKLSIKGYAGELVLGMTADQYDQWLRDEFTFDPNNTPKLDELISSDRVIKINTLNPKPTPKNTESKDEDTECTKNKLTIEITNNHRVIQDEGIYLVYRTDGKIATLEDDEKEKVRKLLGIPDHPTDKLLIDPNAKDTKVFQFGESILIIKDDGVTGELPKEWSTKLAEKFKLNGKLPNGSDITYEDGVDYKIINAGGNYFIIRNDGQLAELTEIDKAILKAKTGIDALTGEAKSGNLNVISIPVNDGARVIHSGNQYVIYGNDAELFKVTDAEKLALIAKLGIKLKDLGVPEVYGLGLPKYTYKVTDAKLIKEINASTQSEFRDLPEGQSTIELPEENHSNTSE